MPCHESRIFLDFSGSYTWLPQLIIYKAAWTIEWLLHQEIQIKANLDMCFFKKKPIKLLPPYTCALIFTCKYMSMISVWMTWCKSHVNNVETNIKWELRHFIKVKVYSRKKFYFKDFINTLWQKWLPWKFSCNPWFFCNVLFFQNNFQTTKNYRSLILVSL